MPVLIENSFLVLVMQIRGRDSQLLLHEQNLIFLCIDIFPETFKLAIFYAHLYV